MCCCESQTLSLARGKNPLPRLLRELCCDYRTSVVGNRLRVVPPSSNGPGPPINCIGTNEHAATSPACGSNAKVDFHSLGVPRRYVGTFPSLLGSHHIGNEFDQTLCFA